jgi:hypothetical protein
VVYRRARQALTKRVIAVQILLASMGALLAVLTLLRECPWLTAADSKQVNKSQGS